MQFTKQARTFADQLTLLKGRGLKIEDEPKALHHLANISYYRLSAYLLSFQKSTCMDGNGSFIFWATVDDVQESQN